MVDELIERAKATPCPKCGGRDATLTTHPAYGAMMTCSCGARSDVALWVKGIQEMEREPGKTTYRGISPNGTSGQVKL